MSLTAPEVRSPVAVAGGGHKVEGGVGLYGPRQVGQKRRRALEHAHHHQLFAVQVAGNLGAHLGHAFGNLLAGKENLEVLVAGGGHADSIPENRAAEQRVLCKLLSGAGRGWPAPLVVRSPVYT